LIWGEFNFSANAHNRDVPRVPRECGGFRTCDLSAGRAFYGSEPRRQLARYPAREPRWLHVMMAIISSALQSLLSPPNGFRRLHEISDIIGFDWPGANEDSSRIAAGLLDDFGTATMRMSGAGDGGRGLVVDLRGLGVALRRGRRDGFYRMAGAGPIFDHDGS